jgi:single-stranded DNA-binding protein
MNKIIISGYIGRDPEVKYLTNGDPIAEIEFDKENVAAETNAVDK